MAHPSLPAAQAQGDRRPSGKGGKGGKGVKRPRSSSRSVQSDSDSDAGQGGAPGGRTGSSCFKREIAAALSGARTSPSLTHCVPSRAEGGGADDGAAGPSGSNAPVEEADSGKRPQQKRPKQGARVRPLQRLGQNLADRGASTLAMWVAHKAPRQRVTITQCRAHPAPNLHAALSGDKAATAVAAAGPGSNKCKPGEPACGHAERRAHVVHFRAQQHPCLCRTGSSCKGDIAAALSGARTPPSLTHCLPSPGKEGGADAGAAGPSGSNAPAEEADGGKQPQQKKPKQGVRVHPLQRLGHNLADRGAPHTRRRGGATRGRGHGHRPARCGGAWGVQGALRGTGHGHSVHAPRSQRCTAGCVAGREFQLKHGRMFHPFKSSCPHFTLAGEEAQVGEAAEEAAEAARPEDEGTATGEPGAGSVGCARCTARHRARAQRSRATEPAMDGRLCGRPRVSTQARACVSSLQVLVPALHTRRRGGARRGGG